MVLTVLYFYGLRRLIQETVVDDDLHLMCSGRQSGDIQLNFPISDRPAGILKYPIHEDLRLTGIFSSLILYLQLLPIPSCLRLQ